MNAPYRVKCEIKQGQPSEEAPVFYRPEREAQILRRLQGDNQGPLSGNDVAGLFREVISCCLNLEQPLTVAYFGPPGTYTEAAAVKQFGHFANTQPMASIDEVFREVESQAVHYGVVPVKIHRGYGQPTLDCFLQQAAHLCRSGTADSSRLYARRVRYRRSKSAPMH